MLRNLEKTRCMLKMFKFSKLVVLVGLVAVSSTSFASGLILKMPFTTNTHVVNDHRHSTARMITDTSPFVDLKIHKGVNQVEFNYETYYHDNGDDIYYKSNEMIVTFNASSAGAYYLKLPKIKNLFDANRFLRTPALTITDPKGRNVAFKLDTMRKNGGLFNRDFLGEVRAYNKK